MHAHPRWIAQAFADALGADAGQLDALLASDDERPLVHLAARPGVLTADELAEQVDGTVGRYSPYAVYLSGGDPGRLAPIRDGAALVQDEGSQLVARALTLAPVDGPTAAAGWICAPGPAARPRCWPRSARRRGARHRGRAQRAARRARRAEHPRPAGRRAAASTAANPDWNRASTGCWSTRRAPGWVRCGAGPKPAGGVSPATCRALAKLQRELLASAIRLTRPGGVVLYATCSPHLAETVGVVADALRRHPVTALDTRPLFDPVDGLGDGPYVQLWPHRHGTDAMFAAALKVG